MEEEGDQRWKGEGATTSIGLGSRWVGVKKNGNFLFLPRVLLIDRHQNG
jgi:hypothetical protein